MRTLDTTRDIADLFVPESSQKGNSRHMLGISAASFIMPTDNAERDIEGIDPAREGRDRGPGGPELPLVNKHHVQSISVSALGAKHLSGFGT